MVAIMRPQSALPRHMIRGSILGPRLPAHELAVEEFEAADQAFVLEFAAHLAETQSLHAETGTLSWHKLPYFGFVLPIADHENLMAQQGGTTRTQLPWGIACRLPGYSDDQLSRREAMKQALANYFVAQIDNLPLPE